MEFVDRTGEVWVNSDGTKVQFLHSKWGPGGDILWHWSAGCRVSEGALCEGDDWTQVEPEDDVRVGDWYVVKVANGELNKGDKLCVREVPSAGFVTSGRTQFGSALWVRSFGDLQAHFQPLLRGNAELGGCVECGHELPKHEHDCKVLWEQVEAERRAAYESDAAIAYMRSAQREEAAIAASCCRRVVVTLDHGESFEVAPSMMGHSTEVVVARTMALIEAKVLQIIRKELQGSQ